MRKSILAVTLLIPGVASTQAALPAYVPVNPALTSRSALYAQPVVEAGSSWRYSMVIDYSNAIERTGTSDSRQYLFDAETLQLDFWLGRDLGKSSFGFINLPIRGGYDGFLDPFLNWYHDLIGLPVPARNARPENEFGWEFEFPDQTVSRAAPGTFLGDVRLGFGHRTGVGQFVLTVTLPTTTTDQVGWGRKTIGTSLAYSVSMLSTSRVNIDGSLALGWTPQTGELASYQKSLFVGAMGAFRWRFSGRQVIFATLWTQSPNWRNTGFRTLETNEMTIDFGVLLKLAEGWPTIQAGMTEDLIPRGPSVDAGFKLGAHW